MAELVPIPCVAPDRIYKNRRAQPLSGAEVVTYMGREVKEIEGKGIFTYYHGVDIPRIGVSPCYGDFPAAMAEVDKVKRVLREYLKNPFLLLRPEKTLTAFNGFADKCLNQWYLVSEFWTPTSYAIWVFLYYFLKGVGVNKGVSNRTAEIVSTLFEYDDAYRYRLNDLMTATTKAAMIHGFFGEVKRLLELNAKREHTSDVNSKFRSIYLTLRFACLIPKVKCAIIKALEAVDWKGWQLTESEIFHTLNWKDYDVQGRSWDERQAWYEEIFKGKKKPQQIKITLK